MKTRVTTSLAALFVASACSHAAPLPAPATPLIATSRSSFPAAPALPNIVRPVPIPNMQAFRLDNGLHVYLVERPDAPDIRVIYFGRAGDETESFENVGLSTLMTSALEHELTDHLDDARLAAEKPLHTATFRDGSLIGLEAHADTLDAVLTQLATTLTLPALSEDAIERALTDQLDALHWSVYDQDGLAREHAIRMLVGDEHALSLPLIGRYQNIDKFTVGHLEARRRVAFAPDNSALLLVGNLKHQDAEPLVRRHLARLVKSGGMKNRPNPVFVENTMRVRALLTTGRIAHIAQVFRAPPLDHPDRATFELLSVIVGELASSRLPMALREQLEQTYAVSSGYAPHRTLSMFFIETEVPPDVVGETLHAIDAELNRLKTSFVTPRELARAKVQVRERLAAAFEQNMATAGEIGSMVLSGKQPPDDPRRALDDFIAQIDGVTAEQIRKAAAYLIFEERGVAVSGPMGDFLDALSEWAGTRIDTFVPQRIADDM